MPCVPLYDVKTEAVNTTTNNWLLIVDMCLHYVTVCWTWRLRSIPFTTIYLRFDSSDSSVYAVSYSSGFDRICLTDLIKSSTATIHHQQFTSRARYLHQFNLGLASGLWTAQNRTAWRTLIGTATSPTSSDWWLMLGTRFGTWPASLYLVHSRSCWCSWETWCKLTRVRWRYTTVFQVLSWRNDVRCHKYSQTSAAGCQPTGSSWIVRRQNWSGWAPDMGTLR